MKLAYRCVAAVGAGPDGVLLHAEGGVPDDRTVTLARTAGLSGTLVVPFSDYATTPSGMERGGPCWYRTLPDGAGTDPITLTRSVVQVADLLADVALDRPVVLGWGQGAVVALGAGLLGSGSVGAVVCVGPKPAHVSLLPRRVCTRRGRPPVLVVESASEGATGRSCVAAALDQRFGRGAVAAEARMVRKHAVGAELLGEEAAAEIEAWLGRHQVGEASVP